MRSPRALLHAMRTRRTQRIDLDEADRLVSGEPPGPTQAGLGILLDALRAPARPGELSAEKATVAAFTAHRRSAVRAARRNRRSLTRSALVPAMAALALLLFGGTAVAARTGNLPEGAQQHAHRLFSALGVPAPRTGPGHHPSPAASTGPSPSPSRAPGPAAVELGWCADWQPGGPSLSSENHRRLRTAAGSEKGIPGYCEDLRRSAAHGSPPPTPGPSVSAPPAPETPPTPPSPSTAPPGTGPAHPAPSHPGPAHPTPSHHHPGPGGPGDRTGPEDTPR
jgi:hypothetical protein